MSEDLTNSLKTDSTHPLPFEEFVRNNITLLLRQGGELQEQQVKLHEQQVKPQEQQTAMCQEMLEAFTEVGKQLQSLDQRQTRVEAGLARVVETVGDLQEDMEDLDAKLDAFIREQLRMKRRLDAVETASELVK
jgi:Fe-S cluster assembly scaffold protein SufB